MGKRRSSKPARKGLSRRAFLRDAGAASALFAAQPFLAASAHDDDPSPAPASVEIAAATPPFSHGVASGDPLSDRVILWTRITQGSFPSEIPVNYVVATDTSLTAVVASGTTSALRENDYTVKVDVTGLVPATTYYYRFTALGSASPIGRTRTLPVGSLSRLRIAVLSCASLAQGYFNAYRRVAQRPDLDLVVHLGDYIYEHGNGEYGDVRGYEPPMEIVTLRDYRTRHNQYKADPDLQELHRQHAMVAVWDDHEIADNAWTGGAANHQSATEGSYATRVNNAIRAYYEWMPIRRVAQDRKRIYRSFRIGDLAELFMLEERLTARSQPLDPNISDNPPLFEQEGAYGDPTRRIINDAQSSWLFQGLRTSTAMWKLIGQGVMLSPARVGTDFEGDNVYFNPDQWDGYKPARDRLLQSIAGTMSIPPVRNAVVLTGDIHSSWAADVPLDPWSSRYMPDTGNGSLAVEMVVTSVTSPGTSDLQGYGASALRSLNPHIKYIDLTRRGYMLLDITPERLSSEWWYVDTVLAPSSNESFGIALKTALNANRLRASQRSMPKAGAPPLAP